MKKLLKSHEVQLVNYLTATDKNTGLLINFSDYESSGGDGVVDWDAIKADFQYWAKILRTWMDEVHGRI